MSNTSNNTTTGKIRGVSACGRFLIGWFRYGDSSYFTPILLDDKTKLMFKPVIPYDADVIVFVAADKRARRTSPFVCRPENIFGGTYDSDRVLAEFVRVMGDAA
jgi:hypothetical protein